MKFAVFYAAFLILYFLVGALTGRRQIVAFVLFFVIVFLYYPLNQDAYVILVYPFAVICLFVSRLRTLHLVLIALMAGVKFKLVYISSNTMNRFQTRVGLGGERESNVYKRKHNWAA